MFANSLRHSFHHKFAFMQPNIFPPIKKEEMEIYPKILVDRMQSEDSSPDLSLTIALYYTRTMFDKDDATLVEAALNKMSDETIQEVTQTRNGLFNYLDVETRTKVSLPPTFLNNGDDEIVNASNDVIRANAPQLALPFSVRILLLGLLLSVSVIL